MPYLYETHMHTLQGSRCGRSPGKEHISLYKELGYTGIIITDHFYGGNTRPERTLPWKDYVNEYCSGYEDALDEGIRQGLDVFFGLEQNFDGDEYLIYGIDKAWLLDHEEIKNCSRGRMFKLVHEAGGCVVQAHPYRLRASYMTNIKLGPAFSDGIEVANMGNEPQNDAWGLAYARMLGLPMTAGSDNHFSGGDRRNDILALPKPRLYGVELEEKLTSSRHYAEIILARRPVRPVYPANRTLLPEDAEIPGAFTVDTEGALTPFDTSCLLPYLDR